MKKNEQNPLAGKKSNAFNSSHFRPRLLPALIASCFACGPVFANPTGAQVVNGQVAMHTNGNVLTVTNSPGSIINWASFSINAGQVTQFLQQSASSSVLNRIIGQNPSQIFGTLASNGKVFLINPNGILFAPGSQINVGGLVASSLDISNADFIAGRHRFAASIASPGSVVNQGSITTPNGGNIYLIAPQVQNSGILTSPQGEVLLAAGHSVQLVDGADPNIQIVISSSTDQAMNLGQVIAEGGKVGIYGALINQDGTVSANSAVVGQNGAVVFKSSRSTTLGQDSVTSATGAGNGGTIAVLGPDVAIIDNALINASGQTGGGKIMIGGDFHGANAAIPNSTSVFVGADSVIKADAIQSGHGGKVAVWSDNSTLFYGNISAQGGATGGNGGYVETSGKYKLTYDGTVNLLASHGKKGTLLLDPYSIVITGNPNDTPQTVPTVGTPTVYISPVTSFIFNGDLNAQLDLSSVLIETGATAGTITVSAPIAWSTENTLAMMASSNININSTITGIAGTLALNSTGGNITQSAAITTLELSAVANSNAPGYGNVTLNNAANSVTRVAGLAGGGGGFQFVNSRATNIGSVAGYTGGASSTINGIAATSGNLQIQSAGNLSIAQSVSSPATTYLSSTTGNILQGETATITSRNVSVYAPLGSVTLNLHNSVTGTVAGTSAGAFSFLNTPSFSVGGTLGNQTGISSSTSVSLTSLNGSILSSGSGAITAPEATINAYLGIGEIGSPLNTAVSTLSVTNGCDDSCNAGFGGGGDIVLSNSGALTVTGIVQRNTLDDSPNSNIGLSNAGLINIAGPITTTNGNIGISSSTGGITAYGAVSTANGSIGIAANGGGAMAIYAPISASGTVALQAGGSISEAIGCGNCTPTISAGSLVAASTNGDVYLTNSGNSIGTIAGSAGGANGFGSGFNIATSSGISVGYVAPIGTPFSTMSGRNGITSTGGTVTIDAGTAGNITIAGPINAGSNDISLSATSSGGSIVQGAGGLITTTGKLTIDAAADVGGSGAGNSVLVNVGSLQIPEAGNVYINSSNTSNFTIDQILATGVVNVATSGQLTTAPTTPICAGACFYPTNFMGSSITLISGGNMVLGSNTTYLSTNGSGPITFYAGFTQTPGSAPVTNVTTSTMTQAGTLRGANINLWANSFADFLGSATFTSTPTYHPNGTPINIYVTGTSVTSKIYDATLMAYLTGGTLVGVPTEYLAYLSLTQSGTYATRNVGTGIAVTATDVLNVPAAFAGNFILIQPTGLTGNITPAQLTVSGQTASSKVYDGTNSAILQNGVLQGVLPGDAGTVSLIQSGTFSNVGPGHNIPINTTDALFGSGASNYVIVQPTGIVADITPTATTAPASPQAEQASQSYIIALNTSVDTVGGSVDSSDDQESGGGAPVINNSSYETNKDGTSTKLYCN